MRKDIHHGPLSSLFSWRLHSPWERGKRQADNSKLDKCAFIEGKGHMGETHIQLRGALLNSFHTLAPRLGRITVTVCHLERRKGIWVSENHLCLLNLSMYPKENLTARNCRIPKIGGVQWASEMSCRSLPCLQLNIFYWNCDPWWFIKCKLVAIGTLRVKKYRYLYTS